MTVTRAVYAVLFVVCALYISIPAFIAGVTVYCGEALALACVMFAWIFVTIYVMYGLFVKFPEMCGVQDLDNSDFFRQIREQRSAQPQRQQAPRGFLSRRTREDRVIRIPSDDTTIT